MVVYEYSGAQCYLDDNVSIQNYSQEQIENNVDEQSDKGINVESGEPPDLEHVAARWTRIEVGKRVEEVISIDKGEKALHRC